MCGMSTSVEKENVRRRACLVGDTVPRSWTGDGTICSATVRGANPPSMVLTLTRHHSPGYTTTMQAKRPTKSCGDFSGMLARQRVVGKIGGNAV